MSDSDNDGLEGTRLADGGASDGYQALDAALAPYDTPTADVADALHAYVLGMKAQGRSLEETVAAVDEVVIRLGIGLGASVEDAFENARRDPIVAGAMSRFAAEQFERS